MCDVIILSLGDVKANSRDTCDKGSGLEVEGPRWPPSWFWHCDWRSQKW